VRPGKGRKILNTEEIDEIIEDYIDGKNLKEISIKYGCSPDPIRRALKLKEIKLRSLSEAFGFSPEEIHFQIGELKTGV